MGKPWPRLGRWTPPPDHRQLVSPCDGGEAARLSHKHSTPRKARDMRGLIQGGESPQQQQQQQLCVTPHAATDLPTLHIVTYLN